MSSSPAETPLSPEARSFGRYAVRERLQRQLGAEYGIVRELLTGGSSSVFLANETALDRPVVLKALPPETAVGMDMERFRREIQFAARLQHPHLVPLLTAGVSIDPRAADAEPAQKGATSAQEPVPSLIPWFSMPYVEGDTLRERLLSGHMSAHEALRIMREVASALSYAHSRGIVHRDIKPENVLLCDGAAMVTDFGVAKALEDAGEAAKRAGKRTTTVSMAIGTPAYMAPEQVNASALVDHKADIYAFGCLAYELFTGEPPLVRPSLRATMAAQLSELPTDIGEKLPGMPAELQSVIMQCLEKDPLKRPHSASVIIRVIDDLQNSGRFVENISRNSAASQQNSSTELSSTLRSTLRSTDRKTDTERPAMHRKYQILLVLALLLIIPTLFLLYRLFAIPGGTE